MTATESRPVLLVLAPLDPVSRASVAANFDMIEGIEKPALERALVEHGTRIQAVLTIGSIGIDAATIARLPTLSFICALGVGYENLDLAAARDRGIALCNGAGTNDDCVADQAFGLLLAAVRQIPAFDRATRDGIWRDALPLQPNFSAKKLGILGLGNIGHKLAKRAAGFDLTIGYHNRTPLEGCAHRYFDSLVGLAQWCDFLVVCTPGGADTRHLVDAAVLKALGPAGYLVNVARGSVVDTQALAAALASGELAGAGLDVYEGEPAAPAALIGSTRVVLSPHVAGRSPEAIAKSVDLFIHNMTLHFAGAAVLTPIG